MSSCNSYLTPHATELKNGPSTKLMGHFLIKG